MIQLGVILKPNADMMMMIIRRHHLYSSGNIKVECYLIKLFQVDDKGDNDGMPTTEWPSRGLWN